VLHTASQRVWDYLSMFSDWREYDHRVLSRVRDRLLPVPINRTTLEQFYGVELPTEQAAEAFLDTIRVPIEQPRNSEELCLSRIGRPMYEAMFEGYTLKQWRRHPRDLDPGVCGRIPVRTSRDDRYFVDAYRGQPLDGFRSMFDRMLASPRITVALDIDGGVLARNWPGNVVWTGPVDQAFGYRHGRLPWRSVKFETAYTVGPLVQPCAVINEPSPDVPWTRSSEYRWLTGQQHVGTTLHREIPGELGPGAEPFYPVPSPDARAQHALYQAEAQERPSWLFCGRLARYQYLEMGQVVGQALRAADELLARLSAGRAA
jgi:UDP-galactopyranose mutase